MVTVTVSRKRKQFEDIVEMKQLGQCLSIRWLSSTCCYQSIIIAERLMGPYSEVVLVCMYVCMYVRNGFTTEVYEFTYSVCTLRHVPVLVR